MEKKANTCKPTSMELLSRHCPLVFSAGTDQRSVSSPRCCEIFSHSHFPFPATQSFHMLPLCTCTHVCTLIIYDSHDKHSLHGEEGRGRRKEVGGRETCILWERYRWAFFFFFHFHRLRSMQTCVRQTQHEQIWGEQDKQVATVTAGPHRGPQSQSIPAFRRGGVGGWRGAQRKMDEMEMQQTWGSIIFIAVRRKYLK